MVEERKLPLDPGHDEVANRRQRHDDPGAEADGAEQQKQGRGVLKRPQRHRVREEGVVEGQPAEPIHHAHWPHHHLGQKSRARQTVLKERVVAQNGACPCADRAKRSGRGSANETLEKPRGPCPNASPKQTADRDDHAPERAQSRHFVPAAQIMLERIVPAAREEIAHQGTLLTIPGFQEQGHPAVGDQQPAGKQGAGKPATQRHSPSGPPRRGESSAFSKQRNVQQPEQHTPPRGQQRIRQARQPSRPEQQPVREPEETFRCRKAGKHAERVAANMVAPTHLQHDAVVQVVGEFLDLFDQRAAIPRIDQSEFANGGVDIKLPHIAFADRAPAIVDQPRARRLHAGAAGAPVVIHGAFFHVACASHYAKRVMAGPADPVTNRTITRSLVPWRTAWFPPR